MDRTILERRIAQGAGRAPADLVIRDVRLYDLTSGDLLPCDIAICGDTIVGTLERYEGVRVIEGKGRIAVPGFLDTHVHVESSLVTPHEFERCVLPHGVTTAICDPHEIANVLGAEGIRWFLACSERLRMSLYVQLSSCVPATHLETAGAALDAADLAALKGHPKTIGLAEFMNFPGVIHADPACLDKILAFTPGHIDGHAPLVRGHDLNGYLAAGIRTDHEATGLEEAREKLRKGMHVLIREGSVSKDLHALAPLIALATSPSLAFCTDDRNPLDIAEEGHIDHMIRTAIALGRDPLAVYRTATISAATAFGLRDCGLIAPGRRADIVLLDDLETCAIAEVYVGGRRVEDSLFANRESVAPVGLDSMKARKVAAEELRIPARDGETPVIGVVPGRIITERLSARLPVRDGASVPDLAVDIVKLAVIERHGRKGSIGLGFVNGFGMKRGAIASSVGHDSHNICVVGVDDADMAAAANRLGEIRGGFAVVENGRVTAELPLPVAGLMSLESFEDVRAGLVTLRAAAKALGVTLAEPFLQVAFLSLPVIPHLKLTDLGMVDVDRFAFVE